MRHWKHEKTIRMRYLKNKILKGITWANCISLIFFACLLDSDTHVPLYICIANMMWLALFGYANNWFKEV